MTGSGVAINYSVEAKCGGSQTASGTRGISKNEVQHPKSYNSGTSGQSSDIKRLISGFFPFHDNHNPHDDGNQGQ